MLYTAITREEVSSQGATGKVVATRKICMHCPLLLYKKTSALFYFSSIKPLFGMYHPKNTICQQ